MKPTPLIALENISCVFDEGRIVALRNIDLAIERGDSIAIVGPSGSGKSTLLRVMCGIKTPSSGRVRWNGKLVTSPQEWTTLRRLHIGIVFQDSNLIPTLHADENIEMALFGTGLGSKQRRLRAHTALQAVGLAGRATHLPHELSGGERQRVAIARSIVNRPSLILADEPTGNLDSVNSSAVMDLLFDLHRAEGTTLIIVTHDSSHAVRCRRRIVIKDGKVSASMSRKSAKHRRQA